MLFQTSLGMNITASEVTLVGLRQTFREVRLVAESVIPIAADQPLADQLDAIAARTNAFIADHKLAGAGLFMGFPSTTALWRTIELPAAARENLPETIRYEMEKYIPLSPDDIYLDHQVIGEDRSAGRLKVLLTVVKREDVAPFIDLAGRLNGIVAGAEPGLAALAHVYQYYPDWCPAENATLLVYAPGEFHLMHLQRGLIQAARALPGPQPDADRIRRGVKALLKANGDESADTSGPVYYAGNHLSAEKIRKWLPDMPEGTPIPLSFEKTIGANENSLPAIGLALRGLMRPKMTTNLLPREMRRRSSRASQFVLFGTILLALLSGLAWGGSHILARQLQQHRMAGEMEQLTAEMADIERLQEEIAGIQFKIDFLQHRGPMPLPALDALKELTGIIPDSAWVRELSVDQATIRIDGYGDNASELISLIDASPHFTEVAFLSAITRGRNGKEKFRIGCRLRDALDQQAKTTP